MKTLFQDGDWRLVVSSLGRKAGWADIQHRCRPQGRVEQWWYYCAMLSCGSCAEPIPDKLRGLKALQDWDR